MTDAMVAELLVGLPAVLITGPRGSGKTNTAGRVASSVVDWTASSKPALCAPILMA